MRFKLSSATVALLLFVLLSGCSGNSVGYGNHEEQNQPNTAHLGLNQNRQFENGYTTNNPINNQVDP